MEGTFVSSAALIELQSELNALSEAMAELYEALNGDMGKLAQGWTDEKFGEFQENFRSRQEMIASLSEKYKQWANGYLPPRIELAIKHEKEISANI